MLSLIMGIVGADGALAFDIAAFFSKLAQGLPAKKRFWLLGVLLAQDFALKVALTLVATLLLELPIHWLTDALKVVGGGYLAWSVNQEQEKEQGLTSHSLWRRLRQGMVASIVLNIDAALTNSTLAQGHLIFLLLALGFSAAVIFGVTATFAWLEAKTSWMGYVQDVILGGTAGYLVASGLQTRGILQWIVAGLVCLLCFGWRWIAPRAKQRFARIKRRCLI